MTAPLRLTIYAATATIAASISLMSVYSTAAWLVPVIGAVVLVAGSCALVRWSPLPSAFEPFTAAVAVLLWVSHLYARRWSRFGFVPDRTALRHLGHLARHGFNDIHNLPAPVPTHKGLVLLTVIGVAAVALIVDLLAVTLRRAALAGLPLLALFTVCAATGRNGVNSFAFISAAGGYLLLLYIDNRERVTRWGAAVGSGSRARPAPTWSTDPISAPAPATLGRRVGAAAIGVSVVVPLLVPGLHSGISHNNGGGGAGVGGGNVHTFDPIVFVGNALGQQVNRPVLDYTTTTTAPGYLRLTSLDAYSRGAFTAAELRAPQNARVSNGIPVVPPSKTTYTTRVTFHNGYQFRWLPVPTTATKVLINGDWRYEPLTATVFSASTTTSGSRYTVVSSPNRPTPAELASDPRGVGSLRIDLQTPNISARVRTLTKQITAHAHSAYDAALDIQRYLTSGRFAYDPSIKGDSTTDPLSNFLFHTKRGFCQQFATAMAVMSRLAGIPSRVAVGFTAGTKQPNGSYLVTTHDAHAWPELWFPHYGWLAFEPTPRGDGQAQTPPYAQARPNSSGGPTTTGPKSTPTSNPNDTKTGLGPNGKTGKGATFAPSGSGGTSGVGLAALLLGVVLLTLAVVIAIPGIVRAATRRRRWRRIRDNPDLVAEAWAELRDSAADAGAPWDEAGTPRTLAAALLAWAGPAAGIDGPLQRLTVAEERDRYAATPQPVTSNLRADTETIRAALTMGKSRSKKLAIALFPTSTMRVLQTKITRVADAIDYLERTPGRATAKLRTRLTPT